MSGESSGWACEVPREPRDNTEVSKIHFFDMTSPFGCNVRRTDYSLVVACVGDSQTADRADVRVNRSRGVRRRRDRVRKTQRSNSGPTLPRRGTRPTRDRKTEQLSWRDERQSEHREWPQKTFERAFISNLQMSDQKYQPFVERNSCAAGVT